MILWLSNLSETEKWAIGIVALLLIGVLAQWFSQRLNHALAIHREKRTRRVAACSAFRSVVLAELGSIYPNAPTWPENIDPFLRLRFAALQTAIETFRPFVPFWSQRRFSRAWLNYRCAPGVKANAQCYHHYEPFGSNPNYKSIFHANVYSLLSFANKT